MVIEPQFDPTREHEFRETRVWLSPKDTTTPVHYDIQVCVCMCVCVCVIVCVLFTSETLIVFKDKSID